MSHKKNNHNNSLCQKIISNMAVIAAGIFLLIISTAALLSARSLVQVNREKLTAVAYENTFCLWHSGSIPY